MSIDADTWVSPSPRPADLVDEAVDQVHAWLRDTNGATKRRIDRAQIAAGLLSDVLSHPAGLPFTLAFIDRVVRPEDPRTAAANLIELAKTDCSFLPPALQLAVRTGGRIVPIAPDVVVPAARNALRQLVGHLIVDARPAQLTRTLKALRTSGVRLNLNLLGEAVLGDREAASRLEGTMALLARDDVDYVSSRFRPSSTSLICGPMRPRSTRSWSSYCRCTTWLQPPRNQSSSISTWRSTTTLI
ncbi:hypothetical protein HMPREF9622_01355 [Cutibacterium modestum HL037PA3]|nr:hypothetical protein HMPREF9621_00967 [Cutibacterium modestum HL037PA2]EFT15580.1 hypothetical protein HMPREF9622_01355 [Cutibacterium modestum HL037PA3]